MSRRFVLGDIHGSYSHLFRLLRHKAGVIRDDLTWCAEDATVILMGDYVNKGLDGIKVVDLLISLQIQAEMLGGQVIALVGNHDLLLLAAQRFGERTSRSSHSTFLQMWLENGGMMPDLDHLTPEHIAWFATLPSMLLVDDHLLMHGDSMLYLQYGQTVEVVNKAFEALMYSFEPAAWDRAIELFEEHEAFVSVPNGLTQAKQLLETYGGTKLVHGHTPVGKMTGLPDKSVIAPYFYHDGLCVNVDGGIYRGGAGIVYEF